MIHRAEVPRLWMQKHVDKADHNRWPLIVGTIVSLLVSFSDGFGIQQGEFETGKVVCATLWGLGAVLDTLFEIVGESERFETVAMYST